MALFVQISRHHPPPDSFASLLCPSIRSHSLCVCLLVGRRLPRAIDSFHTFFIYNSNVTLSRIRNGDAMHSSWQSARHSDWMACRICFLPPMVIICIRSPNSQPCKSQWERAFHPITYVADASFNDKVCLDDYANSSSGQEEKKCTSCDDGTSE